MTEFCLDFVYTKSSRIKESFFRLFFVIIVLLVWFPFFHFTVFFRFLFSFPDSEGEEFKPDDDNEEDDEEENIVKGTYIQFFR